MIYSLKNIFCNIAIVDNTYHFAIFHNRYFLEVMLAKNTADFFHTIVDINCKEARKFT